VTADERLFDMAKTEEKPVRAKRSAPSVVEGTEALPRSPDSDQIIKRLIKRHRGVLERLAKL
jgi:hypothetical protein